MRYLLLLGLAGCTWVSDVEWTAANDRDGDGHLVDVNGGDDCDDGDPDVHPGATEVCNGLDDDCDGSTDEEGAEGESTWYADVDGDGHGDAGSTRRSCAMPEGWVETASDCDDADGTRWPGAPEHLDGLDDDCDGAVDDIEASSGADWSLQGAGGYAEAGATSSGTQDLDGDGIADLVVVVPGAGGKGALGAWYGGTLALAGDETTAEWTPEVQLEGTAGFQASRVRGSLAGEAADTLLLLAPTSGPRSCALFFAGDLDGATTLDDAGITLLDCGEAPAADLVHGGDLDDDGDGELLVGTSPGGWNLGVLAGRARSQWNSLDGKSVQGRMELELVPSVAGAAVVAALEGDLDGDGFADLVVAEPGHDAPIGDERTRGAVYVVYGGTDLLAGQVLSLAATADATVPGAEAGDLLGRALVAGTDVDGDGRADLLAGAPEGAGGLGEVHVLLGGVERWSGSLVLADVAVGTWTGSAPATGAGTSLSSGPDVDGDTVADVLVASGPGTARVWLVSGSLAAGAADLDEVAFATISGLGEPATASLARDLDGDGDGEVLVPDLQDATGGVRAGVLYLFEGYVGARLE